MGGWGPGVFQNDHAMDLLSGEAARWAGVLRTALEDSATSWDDIQGLPIYVHLLATVGVDPGLFGLLVDRASTDGRSSHAVAVTWKQRFLQIEAEVRLEPHQVDSPAAIAAAIARRTAVSAAFDALIAVAPTDDALPTGSPKRKRKKAAGDGV